MPRKTKEPTDPVVAELRNLAAKIDDLIVEIHAMNGQTEQLRRTLLDTGETVTVPMEDVTTHTYVVNAGDAMKDASYLL